MEPAAALKSYLDTGTQRTLIVADSPGRREVLLDTLHAFDLRPDSLDSWSEFIQSDSPLALAVAPLETGFVVTAEPERQPVELRSVLADKPVQRFGIFFLELTQKASFFLPAGSYPGNTPCHTLPL